MDVGHSTDAISISLLKTANDLALAQARMVYESIPSPAILHKDAYISSTPTPKVTYVPPSGSSGG